MKNLNTNKLCSEEFDKKRVLFINPAYKYEIPQSVKLRLRYTPPLASLYLASFLIERGYESDIVSTDVDEIDWEKIRVGNYCLVSFTVFIGDFLKNAGQISSKIKKIRPDLPIVYGGIMASIFPEEMLKKYDIDFVIRYEGEYTFYELVEYLNGQRKLETINGLSYKKSNNIIHNSPRYLEKNLDVFPVPRWDLLGDYYNVEQSPFYYRIMTSKGCPFKCSFCYNRQVEESISKDSPVWRYRSFNHVIAEVEKIHRETGTTVFTIGDDNFLVNKARALSILNHFKKRGFYIEQCIGHMNNFADDHIIESMGGVVQKACYSIESASPKLLKLLNKNLSPEKIPKINQKLYEKGITTDHNFIIGLPTETNEDLKKNVDLMLSLKKINPYVRALTFLYYPLPFTPLESYIIKDLGYTLPRDMEDYENSGFDFNLGKKFRPWLDDNRMNFLNMYCEVFTDAFQALNLTLSDRSKQILSNNPELEELFGEIEMVNRPKTNYLPYVLDRVLKNEKIDLLQDLRDK